MNLSAWRYRNVYSEYGGPIQRIAVRQLPSSSLIQPDHYEAYAYLCDTYTGRECQGLLYGGAGGTGTSKHKNVACYKAISEALERWAFYELHQSKDMRQYGFDIEPTTTGMAAFPGLTKKHARDIARLEAIERWTVCAWWEGFIGARCDRSLTNGIDALFLDTPFERAHVSILHRKSDINGTHAYAFAAARSESESVSKALDELSRNLRILEDDANMVLFDGPYYGGKGMSLNEKRLIFFATSDGYDVFSKRASLSMNANIDDSVKGKWTPRVLIDREVIGPWSRYACVWRHIFEPVSDKHFDSNAGHYFFF